MYVLRLSKENKTLFLGRYWRIVNDVDSARKFHLGEAKKILDMIEQNDTYPIDEVKKYKIEMINLNRLMKELKNSTS